MRRAWRLLIALLLLFGVAGEAWGQETSGQIWANVTLDFPHSERLLFEIDLEPKVQYSGDDTWRALDVTPAVELSVNRWIEVVGEVGVGRTKQSTAVASTEVTPRIGVRVHLFNNLRTMLQGPHPLGRVGVANLTRIEWRNLWYTDDTPSNHEARFRNRSEIKVGLNHAEMSLPNTLYLTADFEFFVPLTGDVQETFATKTRGRIGLGYRHSDRYRFEIIYIRDGTRETEGGQFTRSANIVDFRLKMLF